MLRGIIRNVAKIERKSLLPYKSNDCNFLNNNSFFIFLTFDCNYNFLRSCLYNYYSVISQKYICTSKNKLVLLNRIKTNIGSLLIHNFFLEKSTNCKYKKCNNINCFICKFSINSYYFKLNNIFLPIQNHSSCNSIGFIYIIFCKLCKCVYIGESGRTVSTRLSEHLKSIFIFKENLISSLINFSKKSEVASHFSLKNHSISEHFSFIIFDSDVTNSVIRKSMETDLINIFKLCKIKIINVKQPSHYNMTYLTFLS